MKDLFNKDLKYNPHLRQIQTLINTSNNIAIDYLYKISPGCYLGNHGIEVCKNMGLDNDFIQIALERHQ
jgi:DNA mismatch repair ATPase MutS